LETNISRDIPFSWVNIYHMISQILIRACLTYIYLLQWYYQMKGVIEMATESLAVGKWARIFKPNESTFDYDGIIQEITPEYIYIKDEDVGVIIRWEKIEMIETSDRKWWSNR
jgi:hypothetical protein